ncbi:regulatory particle non-ATPase [Microsporum canis]|uniref:Uncharacterized protein n=1 Tax=Arthroderma otae (strain ATCC MYA-4605 / CBS 113480) TaxID=554155 RepID=C5FZQ9_ARTOC|nr:uncharacterized protein MCYG_08181 [Microsporum canis CBS 113480]EEQ35362.1 predicted protein [Microsporum canis CBS 113480]
MQTPGEDFTGEVTIEWSIWRAPNDISPATMTLLLYTNGVPDEPGWGQPIYIHNNLKTLTLGSACAIEFPLDLMFPRTAQGEKGALIFTVRGIRPRWERLAQLDGIMGGAGKLFCDVMLDSKWNISAEDIPEVAEKWGSELLKRDLRPFWFQYSNEYCEGFGRIEDIFAAYLKSCTKTSSLQPPS